MSHSKLWSHVIPYYVFNRESKHGKMNISFMAFTVLIRLLLNMSKVILCITNFTQPVSDKTLDTRILPYNRTLQGRLWVEKQRNLEKTNAKKRGQKKIKPGINLEARPGQI